MGSTIVNGWAFLVVALAGFLYFALGAVTGAISAGNRPLVLGVLLIVSALFCEWRGLAGRLLGVPLWVWGGVLAVVGLVRAFGPLALAPAVGAGLLGGIVYLRQRHQRKAALWPTAEAALERARDAAAAADLGSTWSALEVALQLPVPEADPQSAEADAERRAAHYAGVITLVRETYGPTLSAGQRGRLLALAEQLSSKSEPLSPEDREWLESLIAHRGV